MTNKVASRREFLGLILVGSLAGCTANGEIPVTVGVILPPEVTQIISDASAVIAKVKTLTNSSSTVGLVKTVEDYIVQLKSGKVDFKSTVGGLAAVLSAVSVFLPSPYNVAASVVVALAKAYSEGTVITARLAMTPEQARSILAS